MIDQDMPDPARPFYHATPAANLPEILLKGLGPRIGPRSQMIGEDVPAIYFYDNLSLLEEALGGWLSDACKKDGVTRLIILKVDGSALGPSLQQTAFTFSCTDPVPASALEIFREVRIGR